MNRITQREKFLESKMLHKRKNGLIVSMRRLKFNLIFLLIFMFCFKFTQSEIPKEIASKAQIVPMSTEHGIELYQKWIDQAVGSLFSAVANKRLKIESKHIANEYGACSKDAKTLPFHAKCIIKLIRNEYSGKDYENYEDERLHKKSRLELYSSKVMKSAIKKNKYKSKWIGSFRFNNDEIQTKKQIKPINFKRAKRGIMDFDNENRQVISRNNYNLKSTQNLMSPFGSVAKILMKSILDFKNKTKSKPWQETIMHIRNTQKRKKKIRKNLEEDSLENMDQFAFRGLKKLGLTGEDLDTVIENPKKLKKFLTKTKMEKSNDPAFKLISLLRDGFKLGFSLSGKNITEIEDKTMKIVSPRFLSVVPEDDQGKNDTLAFLSPSLFSLHNEGKGIENLTSLPNLISGLPNRDQQEWLNLIIEASGVEDQIKKIDEELKETKKKKSLSLRDIKNYEKEVRTKDGTPLYFNKENATKFGDIEDKKINVFQKLEKTYTKEQIREMNTTGYALLSSKQLEIVYGINSPYNDSKSLNKFKKLKKSNIESALEKDIATFSKLDSFNIRQKDIVLSPISFTSIVLNPGLVSQPVLLSPIIFSPLILSPALFGPVILSPWMFVPLVLSPRVLSPLILSPFVLSPVILTPLVLHPVILSPGVLDPVILTPFVLSPIILTPLVLSPLILSPLVLSPLILSPGVASPLILSPFVLSPIIASPQALSGLVLSPYALSPVIWTPLIAFNAILSPSWLS